MVMYTASSRRTANRSNGGLGTLLILFLLTVVPMTLWGGWVLSVIWNWFIPNIFPAVPALSIGQAIGLSLVVSTLLPWHSDDDGSDAMEGFIKAFFIGVYKGVLLLVTGFVVQGIVF